LPALLFIKNQLNNGLTIDFVCGDKEYSLEPGGEVTIAVEDQDCMYFDTVK
jgi:hypothetical protein